jgi:hypothetical protein
MPPRPRIQSSFVLFDVLYADGSRSSNRKVPAEALGGLDGDAPAKAILEAQEREIAKASGKAPRVIATLARSGAKPPGAKSTGKAR